MGYPSGCCISFLYSVQQSSGKIHITNIGSHSDKNAQIASVTNHQCEYIVEQLENTISGRQIQGSGAQIASQIHGAGLQKHKYKVQEQRYKVQVHK